MVIVAATCAAGGVATAIGDGGTALTDSTATGATAGVTVAVAAGRVVAASAAGGGAALSAETGGPAMTAFVAFEPDEDVTAETAGATDDAATGVVGGDTRSAVGTNATSTGTVRAASIVGTTAGVETTRVTGAWMSIDACGTSVGSGVNSAGTATNAVCVTTPSVTGCAGAAAAWAACLGGGGGGGVPAETLMVTVVADPAT